VVALLLAAGLLAGCAASRAYMRGESAARAGDWDAAVAYYQRAVQANPDRPEYKIALERAMQNASRIHLTRARELEDQGQLDGALVEYRKAAEYDSSNRQAAAKVIALERTIRDRLEAARPKPQIDRLREQARRATPEPILNPASREPLPRIQFVNAGLRDILNTMGNAAGINVTFDRDFQDRPYTVQLDNVTFEDALRQILTANQLFYKVLNERTILVAQDTPQKRAQYEEQVIKTFFISNADVQELSQLISSVIRVPQMAVQPMVAVNKTANTITIRATAAVAAIIERIIEQNDKPRAEIIIDVEILEVNRTRAKQLGLNLTNYALGGVFSPESRPSGGEEDAASAPNAPPQAPPFNLNTISQGVSTADFYGIIPSAFVRFLETDSQTKLIAKPQLRGSEGTKLTLNLGDEIPVPSTTFTPLTTGGTAFNPLTSFNYKPVGVNVEMTPRVTYEGDIILELLVESSTLGRDVNIAGQNLPSFGSRKVTTKLRLREGESNLLAGLLREDERRALRGFPGIMNLPVLRQLLSDNDTSIAQTDIVMLLTPRVVRTHEMTAEDLTPIYIGTQQNIGLGGPPPLIAPPPEPEAAAGEPGATPAVPPAGAQPGVPTGPPTGAQPGVPPVATPPGVPGTPPQPAPAPVPPPAPPPPAPPGGQVLVTPPGTEFRVGGGPYTVPLSITGASQVSALTMTVTFNPAVLRVRSIQEGSFMRQGGVTAPFTQQVDANGGRIDIAITRTGDTTGASGSGLLAAILFEPVAPGASPIAASGSATTPAGAPIQLQFSQVAVTVK
jgi:type II secretory pathway component GspD/PulD (secretin)